MQIIHEIVQSIPVTDNIVNFVEINKKKHTFFKIVDIDELREIVFSFSNKRSPDDIDITLIKIIFNGIGFFLLDLVNSCLSTGYMFQNLKISTVILIYKNYKAKRKEDQSILSRPLKKFILFIIKFLFL